MSLETSGSISLNGSTTGRSVAVELGRASSAQVQMLESEVRTLTGIASGQIRLPDDFWGKSLSSGGDEGVLTLNYGGSYSFTGNATAPTVSGGSGNSYYTVTIPSGATIVSVSLKGAGGGGNAESEVEDFSGVMDEAGLAGNCITTSSVSAGTAYRMYVGQGGGGGSCDSDPSYWEIGGGGGWGRTSGSSGNTVRVDSDLWWCGAAGGGGGSTAITTTGDVLVAEAGGGRGGGSLWYSPAGNNGGAYLSGTAGCGSAGGAGDSSDFGVGASGSDGADGQIVITYTTFTGEAITFQWSNAPTNSINIGGTLYGGTGSTTRNWANVAFTVAGAGGAGGRIDNDGGGGPGGNGAKYITNTITGQWGKTFVLTVGMGGLTASDDAGGSGGAGYSPGSAGGNGEYADIYLWAYGGGGGGGSSAVVETSLKIQAKGGAGGRSDDCWSEYDISYSGGDGGSGGGTNSNSYGGTLYSLGGGLAGAMDSNGSSGYITITGS